MAQKKIQTPLTDEVAKDLKIGDNVLITGNIYTARDAAHKRMVELLDKGEKLPFDIKGQLIYYVGPSPASSRSHHFGSNEQVCSPDASSRLKRHDRKRRDGLRGSGCLEEIYRCIFCCNWWGSRFDCQVHNGK